MKFYVQLDSSAKMVQGSGVWRQKKPTIGRWKEVEGNVCCYASTALTTTPADPSITDIELTILCDAVAALTVAVPGTSTDITTLVALLNASVGYLGVFSEDGTVISLRLLQDTASSICSGALTMTVTGT